MVDGSVCAAGHRGPGVSRGADQGQDKNLIQHHLPDPLQVLQQALWHDGVPVNSLSTTLPAEITLESSQPSLPNGGAFSYCYGTRLVFHAIEQEDIIANVAMWGCRERQSPKRRSSMRCMAWT